jgi:hypothetical protein
MSTKASYQEIFASFFKEAGHSEAHWYSFKPLHKDIPSLADLLEVFQENLRKLFVKGGLGKLGQADKSFSFQASQFDSFRAVFMIEENCEVTRCKIKGMKTKQWFVRLGSQYYGDLCNPGTKWKKIVGMSRSPLLLLQLS